MKAGLAYGQKNRSNGSKFELIGDHIEGPARRNLDCFVIQAVLPDGSIKETNVTGTPWV